MSTLRGALIALVAMVSFAPRAQAAGTLVPVDRRASAAMHIRSHLVEVSIESGFVRTSVEQVFFNNNDHTTDAIYSLPLPLESALCEMSVETGTETLWGEVVRRDVAEAVYEAERAAGRNAAIATKESVQRFEFRIANVPARAEVTMRYAYYQPLRSDGGTVRYQYALEEGGVEGGAAWEHPNAVIAGPFSIHVKLRSPWPTSAIRMPGHAPRLASAGYDREAWLDVPDPTLASDVVVEYDIEKEQPGGVQLVAQRTGDGPGTFMVVMSPGADLRPLDAGADYVLVLDISSSMETKLETLKAATVELLGSLAPQDRFRIVVFSDYAYEVTDGMSEATPATVAHYQTQVLGLAVRGNTDLYSGIELGLADLDEGRATSMFLVTDAVANEGIVDGPAFVSLLARHDVRVFGFLMGNSGNWPLLERIAEVTGGFYDQVSNDDDIGGRMAIAREKTRYEAMHDFRLSIEGVDASELTTVPGTAHYGQQLVAFGRYAHGGSAHVIVRARITGRDVQYEAFVDLPDRADLHPEIERLWAFGRVRELEYGAHMELVDREVARDETTALGVEYQIVTDETAMLLVPDEVFEQLGIDRNNRDRTAAEERARMLRDASGVSAGSAGVLAPTTPSMPSGGATFVPSSPAGGSSSGDYGGGAVALRDVLLALLFAIGLLLGRRWKRA